MPEHKAYKYNSLFKSKLLITMVRIRSIVEMTLLLQDMPIIEVS